jgi:hypothetical protein
MTTEFGFPKLSHFIISRKVGEKRLGVCKQAWSCEQISSR